MIWKVGWKNKQSKIIMKVDVERFGYNNILQDFKFIVHSLM